MLQYQCRTQANQAATDDRNITHLTRHQRFDFMDFSR
jgi:hypothetical protein